MEKYKGKIRFAVVGLGHIGKRHADMIQRNPDAELIAVCDTRPVSDTGFTSEASYYSSIKDLLSSENEIDVVNICTPNGLHAEQAILALEKDKHVVCEKPFTLSASSAEEVIHLSLEKSKKVFVVMQNRYSPPSVWLKEIVKGNRLGKIYMVQINCFWNRDARYYIKDGWHGTKHLDGGTLFTQFSHFVDMMYWLFGDVRNIKSEFYNYNHEGLTEFEDSGVITFDFVKGGNGTFNFSTAVYNENLESSMTILGENGTIKVAGQYMDKIEYCNIENYEMPELQPTSPPNDYGAYKGSAANHHFVIQNVIDTLKNKSSMTTNALEGLKVVDIIERWYGR